MKTSVSERIFNVFNVVFMLFVAVIMFYPMWHVLCASLSNSDLIVAHSGVLLFPKQFTFNAYHAVFKNPMIVRGTLNTVILVAGGLALSIVMTCIGAYGLSQKGVYWQKALTKFFTVTMYINGGLIPMYLLVTKTLHLNDSYGAILLPLAINTYYLIIMKTSFAQIPDSLIEASKLDGATHIQILFKVVVPLSMPIIAVIVLYYAVDLWNSWFYAAIYLRTRTKFPLQLLLREILIENDTSSMAGDASFSDQYSIGETIKYAITIVATLPILILFPFLQRYFVKGVMVGAVKE